MTSPVFADGKVLSRASPDVTIPDQQAIIHFADGMETLVIETSFVGEGDEFAWIVPLPAVPEVEEASEGMFRALEATALPIVYTSESLAEGIFITGFLAWLFFVIRWLIERKYGRIMKLVAVSMLLMCCVLLPSTGKARGHNPVPSPVGVTVHNQQQVGGFDVTTVSSDDSDALLHWLESNAFQTPVGFKHAVRSYVNDGWVFVTAKLSHKGEDNNRITRPLRFRFETDKPVYPMRLTGLTAMDVRVQLWFIADRRAEASNFMVAQCRKFECNVPTEPTSFLSRHPMYDHLEVEHVGLANLMGNADVLTKLTATLSPRQMEDDVFFSLKPYAYEAEWYYSQGAVRAAVLNNLMILLAAILFSAFIVCWRPRQKRFVQITLAVLGCLCVVCILHWAGAQKIEKVDYSHPIDEINGAKSVYMTLHAAIMACNDLNEVTPQWARAQLEREARKATESSLFRGVPAYRFRSVDGPHGYTLHRRVGRPISADSPLILVLYNDRGGVAAAKQFPGVDGEPYSSITMPLADILLSDEWQFREHSHDTDAKE